MPFEDCEPCCDPAAHARLQDLWRESVLVVLCAILQELQILNGTEET